MLIKCKKKGYSIVLPGCCERSIKARMPFLYLNYGTHLVEEDEENIENAKPEWRCVNLGHEWIMGLDGGDLSYYDLDLAMNFCPFCGSKLPEIVRVDRPELQVGKHGDYYCGTCDKRNRECECYPETVLFDAKS